MELTPVDVIGTAPLQRVGHTATLLSLPGRPPVALVYGGDCTNNVLDDMTLLKQGTTGALGGGHAPGLRGCSADTAVACGAAGQWSWEATPIVEGAIRPRVSHTAAFVPRQQKVFVFGGGDLKSVRADLWALDICATLLQSGRGRGAAG